MLKAAHLTKASRIGWRLVARDVKLVTQRLPVRCISATSNLLNTRHESISSLTKNGPLLQTIRSFSQNSIRAQSSAQPEVDAQESIIKDVERSRGQSEKLEFQAETRKLLDIVAKSLYSEKEVFIRELISNANDALERLRYLMMCNENVGNKDLPLEIHIAVDPQKKTITVQDTGLGMTKEEIVQNLGVIARSGSKAFLEEIENKGDALNKKVIGQFGVGFYSAFMVAEKVDVYTQSYKPDVPAYKWTSTGHGTYEISEAENVQRGTKVVIHLKEDCLTFANEETVKEVIKKYSNFVGHPLVLNGKKTNTVQALWMLEPKEISDEMHEEFFRFISNSQDKPRYHLHYKTDAPLNIRAIFYVPDYRPSIFDLSRLLDVSLSLYSRKIMILNKANGILPHWLRFVCGVVDSEDIPLNLSRELLQDSALIKKLQWVLTNRLIKFFIEQAKRNPEKFLEFYNDYGLFIREGIVTTSDQAQREEIAKMLHFESSALPPGQQTTLDDYATRMKAGTRTIYYFAAPNRHLAETSSYMEAMQSRNVEVLYCYENYDELVLMNLGQFDNKQLRSIENEMSSSSSTDKSETPAKTDESSNTLGDQEAEQLLQWLQGVLGFRITKAKVTHKLVTHPCIITVPEMGAARHFLRTTLADKSEEEKLRVLQPSLEINPSHPLIIRLHSLKNTDSELARLVAEQLYDNAMIGAGLLDNPKKILPRLNELLTKMICKE